MADQRRAATMQLSGNDYAKVAERLKLFREDFQKSKTETDHTYLEDGSVEFKAWLWKDKAEYMDLIKSGVTDRDVLRSTADADGDAKGQPTDKKAFEKLQTIAVGRALANLGYLGSGDIASFEEMEEFNKFKEQQQQDEINHAVEQIMAAKSNEELNKVIQSISAVLKFQAVIDAGKAKRSELAEAIAKANEKPAEPVKPRGGKQVAPEPEKPAEEPTNADNWFAAGLTRMACI